MIKTFEEFVFAKYSRPVNEAFQSNKLREIIKQHGKPKFSWENKMLYDLKDDEIVDVLNNKSEYWDKYPNEKTDYDQATFMLELEDGTVVVINNLNILRNWWSENAERKKDELFKKRHAERHKGNLGKGGDEIHKRHLEKVDELEQKRFAAKMQPMLSEISEAIQAEMEGIDSSDLDEDGKFTKEFDITLGGEKYGIIAEYEVEFSNGIKKYGAFYYDIIYNLTSFEMWDEDGDKYVTNAILGITDDTYGDLFEPITIDNVEGEIYDYYEYYGVKRSDFY